MSKKRTKQFDFGANWDEYSKNALTKEKIEQAKTHFAQLLQNSLLEGKTFIDIGFGQGLSLLLATEMGAKTLGLDINPICEKVLENNKSLFPTLKNTQIPVFVGSILDESIVNQIKKENNRFDIVHSWGVLHHTGNMWQSIENAADLVKNNGKLIIAIYNKHWSSFGWKIIKKMYNFSPNFVKKLIVYVFYLIIAFAKFLVTFKNPFDKERGMSFYYDVVDWVGGYPYEYATKNEIQQFVENKGFKLIHFNPSQVPTGCYEYVFEKIK